MRRAGATSIQELKNLTPFAILVREPKIFKPREGTKGGEPGYEDEHEDESKGVVLSLLRSEIKGGREEDSFRNPNPLLEAFLRFLFPVFISHTLKKWGWIQ